MRAGGEIVERLTGRVDLIVMAAVRERQQLIEPDSEPGCILRDAHLIGFESGRLGEEACFLIEAGPVQDSPHAAGAPQILRDRPADICILDDGLVGFPAL
jgi:hypothetical protein